MKLQEIDLYILASLKKQGRTTIAEINKMILASGKRWHYQYICRRLGVLKAGGLVYSPTRSIYEITEVGAEIVKNTKIMVKQPEIEKEVPVLVVLTNIDKKIISFLYNNKKCACLQEIIDNIQDDRRKYYATTVSRRLKILKEAGIVDKEGHDMHRLTDYGKKITKAVVKEHKKEAKK